jgi:hypothetical protein
MRSLFVVLALIPGRWECHPHSWGIGRALETPLHAIFYTPTFLFVSLTCLSATPCCRGLPLPSAMDRRRTTKTKKHVFLASYTLYISKRLCLVLVVLRAAGRRRTSAPTRDHLSSAFTRTWSERTEQFKPDVNLTAHSVTLGPRDSRVAVEAIADGKRVAKQCCIAKKRSLALVGSHAAPPLRSHSPHPNNRFENRQDVRP